MVHDRLVLGVDRGDRVLAVLDGGDGGFEHHVLDPGGVVLADRMRRIDLDFDVQVVVCPIIREADGLAMSSRNTYLTPRQRADAPILKRALHQATEMMAKGECSATQIKLTIEKQINSVDGALIDYVAVVNAHNLEEVEMLDGDLLIAVAVKFGKTRLIDNVRIEV